MSARATDTPAARSAARAADRRARRRPGLPSLAVRAAHLAVLTSFAFAQPLFDILGRNATFFVVRGSSGREIVLFALALTLLPPVVLTLVELAAGVLDRILQAALHILFVAALAAVIALEALNKLDWPAAVLLSAAVLFGGAVGVLYRRARQAQTFLTLLSPAPLVFLALFLGGSDVSELVFGHPPAVRTVHTQARTAIVLIALDEFNEVALMDRNGQIDARRYPHFAELARESNWYRDATTVGTHTEKALPAILTGDVSASDSLPTYADHPHNLFTLFGGDYRLHVFETETRLCPQSLCARTRRPVEAQSEAEARAVPGGAHVLASDTTVVYLHLLLPDRLAARVTPIADSWGDFKGLREGGRTSQAEPDEAGGTLCGRGSCSLLRSITRDRRPSLYFAHVLLPHVPWTYLPSGKRYTGNVRVIPGVDDSGWRRDDWLTLQAYQRYLLQVAYTDRALGRVLARLRATGVYDRAVIVVAPDHGTSFRPGEPRRDVTRANLQDIAFIPLFVKLPGQKRGRVVDGYARSIDILPTIADAVHAKLPWRVEGRSLLGRPLSPDGEVKLPDSHGNLVTASLSTLRGERRRALDRQIAAFGTGSLVRLYRIGPHQDLLGKRVLELPKESSKARVEIDGAQLLNSVDLHSEVVPTYITGRISGGSGEGEDLAVAVNGTVAAMTRSFDEFGDERFAALVPERLLHSGSNSVEVFVVGGTSERPVLERLRAASSTLAISKRGAREVIDRGEGESLDIVSGALSGEVHASTPGESVILEGWAADLAERQPADSVGVFLDGKSVLVLPVNLRQKAAQERYGIERAGFRAELPKRLLPKWGQGYRLRILALRGDVASELRYEGGYLRTGRKG